jgi:DNA-binding MarR family transcriptional regulator
MKNTITASEATELCIRLTRAAAVLGRRFGNLHGLSFADYQLLRHLAQAPEGRLRRVDLAERLALSASGVTRSLLPLEKIGLVARQSDPRDARVGYALITPAGRELVEQAQDTVDRISLEVVGGADATELGALATLLGQIGP